MNAEEKIRLQVLGFSRTEQVCGTCWLVLGEAGGERRLSITMGAPEAQSIAYPLSKKTPVRPLSHDLLQSMLDCFQITLRQVFIYRCIDDVYYSQLLLESDEQIVAIDCRTSDAIAIALRTKSPIYTTEQILLERSVRISSVPITDKEILDDELLNQIDDLKLNYKDMSLEDLSKLLGEAVNTEDYEMAAILRDEIQNREFLRL